MKSYRIVFRYGSKSSWKEVSSNNDAEVIYDVFKHLCDDYRDDPEKLFRLQVRLGGEYHTLAI